MFPRPRNLEWKLKLVIFLNEWILFMWISLIIISLFFKGKMWTCMSSRHCLVQSRCSRIVQRRIQQCWNSPRKGLCYPWRTLPNSIRERHLTFCQITPQITSVEIDWIKMCRTPFLFQISQRRSNHVWNGRRYIRHGNIY